MPDPPSRVLLLRQARPNSQFAAVRTNENSRTSHYNGMLVSMDKNLSHHIQFNASYTWSHAITSGEDFFGISEPGDYVNIQTRTGPGVQRYPPCRQHGVVVLDSGHGQITNRFRWSFANNLGLSWVGQFQSGRPYPVSTGTAGFAAAPGSLAPATKPSSVPTSLRTALSTPSGLLPSTAAMHCSVPTRWQHALRQAFPRRQCNAMQNTFAPRRCNFRWRH